MAYVRVEVDADDFDDDELIETLTSRGYNCSKNEPAALEGISRVEHLAQCGLTADAVAELIRVTETSLGIRLH